MKAFLFVAKQKARRAIEKEERQASLFFSLGQVQVLLFSLSISLYLAGQTTSRSLAEEDKFGPRMVEFVPTQT